MTFDVIVAVIGGWLPTWEPPICDQGFDVPYADRMKVTLVVDENETLDSVYRRAIDVFQPRAKPLPGGGPIQDPLATVFWVMFHQPTDDNPGRHKHYETPRDLIVVGADGLARWGLDRGEITYGDLVRSGRYGLLHGDPLRPYLHLQTPQGGGGLHIAWEVMLHAWEVLEGLYVTGQAARFLNSLRKRLGGRRVLEAYAETLEERGGNPADVMKTVRAAPWVVEDLRAVMGFDTDEEARQVLELAGCNQGEDGCYRFSDAAEEARFLAMAEDDVFRLVGAGLNHDNDTLRARFEAMLRTGEPPPRA